MTQERIARINALAQKACTPEGLTPEEAAEQRQLREEYIAAVRENLRAQLEGLRPSGGGGAKRLH